MSELMTSEELVAAIIAAAGGVLHGKTRLYKAFYAAHLAFWKRGNGYLTEETMVKMPHGPGIHGGNKLLAHLEQIGSIVIDQSDDFFYPEFKYRLVGTPPQVSREQLAAIEEAVKWIEGRSAAQLSQETHDKSISWNEASEGDALDIYVDLMDYDEYLSVQDRLEEELDFVRSALGAKAVA
jgi:hypothetical protein